jgi:hypothetical protein
MHKNKTQIKGINIYGKIRKIYPYIFHIGKDFFKKKTKDKPNTNQL